MAIAVDNSAALTNWVTTGTSQTIAYTCSGSDRLLLVGIMISSSSDLVTGVTYSGTAMSRQGTTNDAFGSNRFYLYSLIAPATGSNNVVISLSSSTSMSSVALSYTGVKQTGFPDSSVTSGGSTGTTSFSLNFTTVADNCWLACVGRDLDSAFTPSAGTTDRVQTTVVPIQGSDSNGARTPAGSQSLAWTSGGSNRIGGFVGVSFGPVVTTDTLSVSDSSTTSESAQIAQADTINAAPRFIPELIIH